MPDVTASELQQLWGQLKPWRIAFDKFNEMIRISADREDHERRAAAARQAADDLEAALVNARQRHQEEIDAMTAEQAALQSAAKTELAELKAAIEQARAAREVAESARVEAEATLAAVQTELAAVRARFA